MKKYIIVSVLGLIGFGLFFAGVNDRTRPQSSGSVFNVPTDVSYVVTGGGVGDTLVVSDTIQVPIYVAHSATLKPFVQLYWQKIGAGTATITATFWQSNDGVNYTAIPKGKLQAAYSKSLVLTATGTTFISFAADSAILEGRYLKAKYITSSTASVKGKMTHRIKFNL